MAEMDELKDLDPRQRIAKLKQMQEKKKKEIEEAKNLITQSEDEIAIEEELKHIPIPQVKSVDIDALFSAEEKEVFKIKRFLPNDHFELAEEEDDTGPQEHNLEETVQKEHPQQAQAVVQYGDAIEDAKRLSDNAQKLTDAYDTVKTLATKASNGIYMNQQEQQRLQSYENMAQELYESGFRPQDPSEEDRLSAAGELLYQARL